MAERDPRYFKVYQDGDDRELERKVQQIVESGAAPGIDMVARESIDEIQRKIDSGEIGGGGGGSGIDPKAREDIQKVTEQLAGKVSKVNGKTPDANGNVTIEVSQQSSNFNGNRVSFYAHRGAEGHAPENTMKAFEIAIEMGYDGYELDAQVTSDGHWVLMHDDTVDRTTDGTGMIKDLSLIHI